MPMMSLTWTCLCDEPMKIARAKKPSHFTPTTVRVECDSCESRWLLRLMRVKGNRTKIGISADPIYASPQLGRYLEKKQQAREAIKDQPPIVSTESHGQTEEKATTAKT